MEENLKQELKSIKLIYLTLVIGVVIFILITIYLNKTVGAFADTGKGLEELKYLFLIFGNTILLVSVLTGIIIFNKKLKYIKSYQLSEKINKYREAIIVRGATIEAPTFVFIIGFLLVGSNFLLFEGVFGLILLLFFFPTDNRIANEIKHDIREI